MDTYFPREAKIIDIVYDLDKDYFRTFTLDRNIHYKIVSEYDQEIRHSRTAD